MSGQMGSSGKSGYFSFVDLVDLIGIEKLLGVAEIDLLADKYIEQVRVDMSVQPEVQSEEHTSELQSQSNLVCRLLLEKKKTAERPRLGGRQNGSSYQCLLYITSRPQLANIHGQTTV